MENPNFYAVIPATVRYCPWISDFQKLLYAEITALTQKDWFCWASNNYFANLFGKVPETISRAINDLEKKWFLKIFIEKEKWNLRKIYIWEISSKKAKVVNINSIDEKVNTTDKNIKSYWQKNQAPIDENVNKIIQDNNKNNNKISKDILYEKKQNSFLEIFEEKILKNEEFLEKIKNKFEFENESLKSSAENFLIYWTEKNENWKKERWQMQKTFDIQKRFYTWLSNEKKWNFWKNKNFQNKTWYVNMDF